MKSRSNEPPLRAALRNNAKIFIMSHAARPEHRAATGKTTDSVERDEIRATRSANVIERHDDHPRRPQCAIDTRCAERASSPIVERKNRLITGRAGMRECAWIEQGLGAEHRHERRGTTRSRRAKNVLHERVHRRKLGEARVEPYFDARAE